MFPVFHGHETNISANIFSSVFVCQLVTTSPSQAQNAKKSPYLLLFLHLPLCMNGILSAFANVL